MTPVRLAQHDATAAAPYRDRLLELWPSVFGPVADEHAWRTQFCEQHRGRADFRLITAEHGASLLGFAWGYTGERGQWWADMVHAAIETDADGWVGGHFEVVELAVSPEHQGRGLGGALFDALLVDLDHDRALLQTDADPRGPGHRLYLRRGWAVLGELSPGKAIMGTHLAR